MKEKLANILVKVLSFVFKNSSDEKKRHLTEIIHLSLLSAPVISGPKERLIIGRRVSRANTLFNTRSGSIKIGQGVIFGHHCMVLTGFHDYTKPGENRERVTLEDVNRDVIIEDGVWVASGVIIIGPCCIGRNAVIGSGSVVVKDIPPNTFAAGNPAKVIKQIEIS